MPSRGASPRDQTVPCGLPNPLAFVSQVRAASSATKSVGSRPPVQLPNSRSPRTEVDSTASRLGETARYGSLSTMEAGSDAWCFLDRQTPDCDFWHLQRRERREETSDRRHDLSVSCRELGAV